MMNLQKWPGCKSWPTSPSCMSHLKIFLLEPLPCKNLGRFGPHSPTYQWSCPWSPLHFFIFPHSPFCICSITQPSASAHGKRWLFIISSHLAIFSPCYLAYLLFEPVYSLVNHPLLGHSRQSDLYMYDIMTSSYSNRLYSNYAN